MNTQLEWRDVVGYEQFYQVSEDGQVKRKMSRRSRKAGSLLSPNQDRLGYVGYFLRDELGNRKRWAAHRLVAEAFIGKMPTGMEVNHKDRDKHNNHHSNLEYVTHGENIRHAYATGNFDVAKGERVGTSKLTSKEVAEIIAFKRHNPKLTRRELAAQYGVTTVNIGHILRGRSWRHIDRG